MFKIVRFGFPFLSLLLTAQTWAAQGPCTTEKVDIGGFTASEILDLKDLRKAVLCAVNRAGRDVIGENAFHFIFHTRIDEADINQIKITRRYAEYEPLFNQKNLYAIKFRAVFENRILTTVRCTATVDYQKIPAKHVVLTLSDCRANHFGNDGHKLEAMAPYVRTE